MWWVVAWSRQLADVSRHRFDENWRNFACAHQGGVPDLQSGTVHAITSLEMSDDSQETAELLRNPPRSRTITSCSLFSMSCFNNHVHAFPQSDMLHCNLQVTLGQPVKWATGNPGRYQASFSDPRLEARKPGILVSPLYRVRSNFGLQRFSD